MATVEKRGDSYRIIVSAGYDSNHRQIRKTMTWRPDPGTTKRQIEKELERQKVLFEERVRSGQCICGDIRFKEFSERWFQDYAKDHLRRRTYCEYQKVMPRIYLALGHIRLDRLQPHHLLEFYKQLESCDKIGSVSYRASNELMRSFQVQEISRCEFAKKAGISYSTFKAALAGKNISQKSADAIADALGVPIKTLFQKAKKGNGEKLSPKTILHYHTVISSILERAVKWQIIRENPCRRIDAPKVPKREIECLDDISAARFAAELEKDTPENQALFALALYVGLRRSELLGLEWPDVDFESGVISIHRTSQYDPSLGVFEDTTKTERSKRSVRVTDYVLQVLKSHRANQAALKLKSGDRWDPDWIQHPRVFTSIDGKPMSPSTPLNRLKRLLHRSDLPDVSLHSLRHTSASLLIGQGVDIRTVSGRLGHSQTSTTLNIYAHHLASADAAAAEAIDLALKGKGKKKA